MTEATMAAIPALPASPRRTARRLMLLGGGMLIALAIIALAAPLIAPLRSGRRSMRTGCWRHRNSPICSARTRWAAMC